jgi:hypothetical protein
MIARTVVTLDPEQRITLGLLTQIAAEISLKNEVPPRLVWRALTWAYSEIHDMRSDLEDVVKVVAKYNEE